MKLYQLQKLQQRRRFVQGRFTVGVDPAKARHQAQLLSADGLPLGRSFSFPVSSDGFRHRLWNHLAARLRRGLCGRPRAALTERLVPDEPGPSASPWRPRA